MRDLSLFEVWSHGDGYRTSGELVRAFEPGGLRKLAGHLERLYRLRPLLAA